jgi:hypothetical protein
MARREGFAGSLRSLVESANSSGINGAPGGIREQPSAAKAAATRSVAGNPRPSGSKTDPNERSNAYLRLLLCEQRHIAAGSGIGDGSRLYPAPDLVTWAHPPPPMGVGLLGLGQPKNKRVVQAWSILIEPMSVPFHK